VGPWLALNHLFQPCYKFNLQRQFVNRTNP